MFVLYLQTCPQLDGIQMRRHHWGLQAKRCRVSSYPFLDVLSKRASEGQFQQVEQGLTARQGERSAMGKRGKVEGAERGKEREEKREGERKEKKKDGDPQWCQ